MKELLFKAAVRRSKTAHTLVEIIFVLAIIAALFALISPVCTKGISESKQTAKQLIGALQLARQIAIEHGTHTRLVFANEEISLQTSNKLAHAYGLYEFYIPHSSETNFSKEYVGQWIPLAAEPEWKSFSDKIEIPFAKEACDEGSLRALYFNPPQCWEEYQTNFFGSSYAGCVYPKNYWQTPYPTSYPLAEQTNLDGKISKNFQVSENTNQFFNLRGIEFDEKGKTTFTNKGILIFDRRNTNDALKIMIDKETGVVKLK